MTNHLRTLLFVFVIALAAGAVVWTQEPPQPAQPPVAPGPPPPPLPGQVPLPAPGQASPRAPAQPPRTMPLIPLKVQIVISRYQGEKRVSSLPYTLSVTANDGRRDVSNGQYRPNDVARLRMGGQVPVPMAAAPVVDGKQMPTGGPVQYKDVGTNIDCYAGSADDGRFEVHITIDDTSVYAEGQAAQGAPRLSDIPTFRSFRSSQTLLLRDGQTTQFTTAADKVSGEVTKVDVTLTVVK